MKGIIRAAKGDDIPKVISFLQKGKVDSQGVEQSIENFLLLENEEGEIQGTLGLITVEQLGILRSFVVSKETTELELFFIFEQMLKYAQNRQLKALFLVTKEKNSLSFFSLLGFRKIDRENIPQSVVSQEYFRQFLNVDNVHFMITFL